MGATENKQLIAKMFESGDPSALPDMLADDVRWTVIGTSVFSGTYEGKQDLMQRLLGPVFEQLESPGGMIVDNIVAEGDYVVVQARGRDRMTKTGRPYNNTYCLVLRLSNGKIAQLDEYCDTELVTAAFGSR